MERINKLKNPRIYIYAVVVLFVTVLFFPNEGRFKYKYKKGEPWMYETLFAQFDFPILKTNDELMLEKEKKASEIIPYYIYNQSTKFEQIEKFRKYQLTTLQPSVVKNMIFTLEELYDKGIVSSYYDNARDIDQVILVQKDKRAESVPITEVYDLSKAEEYLKIQLERDLPNHNIDSIVKLSNLYSYLVPNLILDAKTTELFHKEAIDYISPTKGIVYSGQLIASEGEIITSDIKQMLDSYKAEFQSSLGYSGSYFKVLSGHILFAFGVMFLLLSVIYFVDISIFSHRNKYSFILIIYLLVIVATVVVRNVNPSLLYIVPYAVFAIYLLAFFKQSLAFPLYIVMLTPLLLLTQNGVELFSINLLAGVVAMISFHYLNRGWLQFLNALFIFIALLMIYFAFRLISEDSFNSDNVNHLIFIGCNALFVVGAYPLVFLFEKIFSLVSSARLYDLSDTSNRLLEELSYGAPGTFQHSLQVSNLATAAAKEIGGNVLLVRVGALYHDIGKLNNPQCFIENQPSGVNYHKDLSPIDSATQIIRHVDDGLELAKKHRLPDVVTDFIATHHAKTVTAYFYRKYCDEGGDPNNVGPFTYHGKLPQSKEHVIVLMADAVEAASRTLKEYTQESISSLVESIISSKLSDSQLAQADISIKEINIIKAIFKRYIQQVYHQRIVYPKSE
jgi:cyclic-di-AMP phosphodiesterase PgpH